MLWLAPITVLGFVVLLALMYGWVGEMNSIGSETAERPERETTLAAQLQAVRAPQGGNLAHHLGPQFPAGIGNEQIQLIEKPFSAGVGGGQIQLIGQPAAQTPQGASPAPPGDPAGMAAGGGQLAHQEGLQVPAGIGNQPMQFIDRRLPVGVGGGQIQLINQNVYLGLNLSELTPDQAGQLNLSPNAGLYVKRVVPGSPAEKAGLKAGDVLIECDGAPVAGLDAAARAIGGKKVGQSIKLAVNRNGSTRTFVARMSNVPMGLDVGALRNAAWVGADVQSIDAVMKIQFNLPDQNGVIVTQVAPNSPAAVSGLQVGDVIRRVGETRIRDVEQLESIIQKNKPGGKLGLTVLRDGRQEGLNLALGRKNADPSQTAAVLPPGDVTIEGSWIGMDVAELSPGDVADMGLPADTKGILVSDVEGSPATVAGFQVGDVIIGVNGVPTPDMNQFEAATQKQAGAVVDVIRGNRHIYMSVAPPGYTVQGSQLNTGLDKRFRQVAMQTPVSERFAVATMGPALDSPVAADVSGARNIIVVDPGNNQFAVLDAGNMNRLPDLLSQNSASGLVCGSIAPQLAKALSCAGIRVYGGVVGSASDAVCLYQANRLIAMKGF